MLLLLITPFVLKTTPTDIFPAIRIPVVSVIWGYTGLPPDQMSVRSPIQRLPESSQQALRPPKPMPVQDEWGFFDPQQCGFAALLAKLDEIIDTDEEAPSWAESMRILWQVRTLRRIWFSLPFLSRF